MAICLVTGKSVLFGNHSSKSNNKVRRIFRANIQNVTLISKYLGKCKISITSKGLKHIEIKGGLDSYLESAKMVYGEKGRKLYTRYNKAFIKKSKQEASSTTDIEKYMNLYKHTILKL